MAAGARPIGIFGQSAHGVREYATANEVPFPLLVDPSRAVVRAYGVYNFLWFDAFNIARPATFVLDREQVIRSIRVSENQWQRPTADEILADLRALG
jgi:peroxiredoxin